METTQTSRSEDSANSYSVSTASSNRKRAYRTSRAHFYWVTREPLSFEWFKGVMNEVAEMDKKVGVYGAILPSRHAFLLLIAQQYFVLY